MCSIRIVPRTQYQFQTFSQLQLRLSSDPQLVTSPSGMGRHYKNKKKTKTVSPSSGKEVIIIMSLIIPLTMITAVMFLSLRVILGRTSSRPQPPINT